MDSLVLQNSPSLKSINQAIYDSQIIKEHLQGVTNQYASLITELMDETDPKNLLQKSVSTRLKLIQDLQNQNRDLLQRNAILEQQLKKLKSEHKTLKAFLTQNQQIPNQIMTELESSSNKSSDSAQKPDHDDSILIGTQKQNQTIDLIEQRLKNARLQAEEVEKNWQKVLIFLQDVFERLSRMVDFQKIGKNEVYDEQKLTVTLSKQKYDLLFDFYAQSRSFSIFLPQKTQQENVNEVEQFKTEQNKEGVPQNTPNQKWSVGELEKIFEALASSNGLAHEWQNYLKNRPNQSETQLTRLREIASGKNNKQNQSHIDQSISTIKLNQSLLTNNTQILETTASLIKYEEKQIEAGLFIKLRDLMKNLAFSQMEFDIFNRFDQRRKCQRLFDLDEFLDKFKDKTDLSEISEEYTIFLIRTINYLLVNVMKVLVDSNSQNPQNLSWFVQKLNQKSRQVKEGIFEVIREQCSQYVMEKKAKNEENGEKKSKISKIRRPKFDKEKQLENKLAKVIDQYRGLLRQSLFNLSKEIRVIL